MILPTITVPPHYRRQWESLAPWQRDVCYAFIRLGFAIRRGAS
jgi:hypothetical protein